MNTLRFSVTGRNQIEILDAAGKRVAEFLGVDLRAPGHGHRRVIYNGLSYEASPLVERGGRVVMWEADCTWKPADVTE